MCMATFIYLRRQLPIFVKEPEIGGEPALKTRNSTPPQVGGRGGIVRISGRFIAIECRSCIPKSAYEVSFVELGFWGGLCSLQVNVPTMVGRDS
ncbi:hypothetical protein AVEN_121132-1 [Araneus ventricosus]|uniref:Uncharacterized protein n=1 Tax=Araneus ventricosus TaxID=182803 RepID=A0A4Y2E2N9_ARAVE|nr:hypothetical protein AVEN_121132-1 [Araneus ventricosus]